MRVEILGPVQVWVDERLVTPAGKRERALLSLLALTPDVDVPVATVATGLWGALTPPDVETAVAGVAARARAEGAGDALVEQPGTLRLHVGADDVDALKFEGLVTRAGDEEPAAALATLDQALALWRGPAFADIADVPVARGLAEELTERRLRTVEERFEVLLVLGRSAEVVDAVAEAARDHPTRERLWGQLMTALHREHRTEDAIAVYAEARASLADELGIEPGEALQRIEAALLREDPVNDQGAAAPRPREAARLPTPRTPTVGRDALVDRVCRALGDPDTRLVTLTGLGGSGKTRVATVAAARLRDGGREVAFHELTERSTPDDVLTAVTQAVGEDEDAGIGDGPGPLVVLDNIDACPEGAESVARVLDRMPGVTLLVTSRLPLRHGAEHAISVTPLTAPPAGAPAAEVGDSPAVQLFLRIAEQSDPDFELRGHEAAVAGVCRLLDGVPLALELAAARVNLVGIDGIRSSIETGLEMLRTTAPDVPERQRVLASTIAWSHDRLTEGARLLCRRLVVFEQAFTLEAVEAVSADLPDVIENLVQIMEAGLIRPVDSRVRIGFVMPATVRGYVRTLITDPREHDPARLALVDYLLANVLAWEPELDRPEGVLALARFMDVGGDVLAAVEAALRLGRIDEAVRLNLAAGPFWIAAGELRQGLSTTLGTLRAVARDSVEAGRLHSLAGRLTYHLTEYPAAVEQFERAIAVAEGVGDEATVASSRCFYGATLLVTDAVDRGTELAKLGAEAAQRLGLYPLVAEGLGVLAISHAVAGEFDAEREMHLARLEVARDHGDIARTADALNILAEIALDESDPGIARAYAQESLAIAEPALPMEARDALITLARSDVAVGDLAAASVTLGRALEAADRIGQSLAVAQCFRVAGCLAAARGQSGVAVRLYAAAQRLAPSPNGTDDPVEGDLAGGLDVARSALGGQAFRHEWTLGSSLPGGRLRDLFSEVVDTTLVRVGD